MTGIEDFINRLRKNHRHLARWARRRGIDCYRVYDRDIPEFAFVVDVYGTRAHLQEYDRGEGTDDVARTARRADAQQAVGTALELPLDNVVLKRRVQRQAGEQHQKTGESGEDFVVTEGGHRFIVNLHSHLDTGLFLDHRITRQKIQEEAGGKRFLNLFCYTGSFTIYAAAGGASSSVSLDLSHTYLDWAGRNFDANRIEEARHPLIRADAMQWLDSARREGERFDLIMLDPPSISKSKAMAHALDVQRDHPGLIEDCARLLNRGGVLYFSTNLQRFRLAEGAFDRFEVQEISELTIPEDFRNRRIHRCWRATLKH